MVLHHSITVNREDPKPQIGEIIKHIKPNWPTDQLKFKTMEGGMTNTLYGVYLDNPDDMVLVIIFGKDSELYVNRERERKTMNLLAPLNLAPQLYATFDNGNAYEFIPGRQLENSDLRVMEISDLIAQEIGRLHAVPVPADYAPGQTRGSFFVEFEKIMRQVPKTLDDPKDNERYQKHFAHCDLQKEMCEMEKMIVNQKDDLVMVHHHLLENSIILSKDGKQVRFIDFEYTGLDYGSIDIAIHFTSFINFLQPDPVRFPYPTEDHKIRFITKYLEARYPGKQVTKEALEIWCKRVNTMLAMCFLYGAVWCVMNKLTSSFSPDFDFIGLAVFEMEEYRKLKNT